MTERGLFRTVRAALIAGVAIFAISACGGEAPAPSSTTESVPAAGAVAESRTFAEGDYFRVLENPVQTDRTEPFIVEYFWAGCPACQRFEPIIQGVKQAFPEAPVVRLHAVFNQRWALDARIYHAASEIAGRDVGTEMLGFYQSHAPDLPDFADLSVFFQQQGLDEEAVFDLADSPSVVSIMEQTFNEMQSNEIPGVPAVVVNGRYLVKNPLPEDIQNQEDYNQLIDYLLSLD
ncbi:DSBA-like thioredoxin [Idiomarina sp. A28L]|uniref:DsbA family protein n=1 Tax=Idiomarina sp. A28L TaxID=1036674 RepID=UPI0002138DD9|nr:DsbA family protein [Idiomarina sp. A28L]EGN75537.1 DSBA-like thioredoxin [Idiomarina sp. A28L]